MSDCGTIDESGFRADLRAISQNDYPPLQLVKLPFNWFAPQTGGLIQSAIIGNSTGSVPSPGLLLSNTKNGNAILVFFTITNNGPASGELITDYTVTDTQGNTYVAQNFHQTNFVGWNSCCFLATGIVGGSTTLTIHSATYPLSTVGGFAAIEIGGVTGVRGLAAGAGTVGPVAAAQAGDFAFAWAGGVVSNPTTWTQDSGWSEVIVNPNGVPGCGFVGAQLLSVTAPLSNTIVPTPAFPFFSQPDELMIVLEGDFVSTAAGVPAPLTSVPLPGPCNFIALVSEAIDEEGQYQQSALIGQQAAAGFIRLNGGGNVWIPISFVPALIPGYVTSTDNFANNPIQGTGFCAIEAPFGVLDWQPASPVFYTGATAPTTPDGYLLAFVGLNVGVGAAVGNGSGSTHAIPTAAGPIVRMKDAGLL